MRQTYLMIFAALVATGLVAQTVTNPPASPPIEAPAGSSTTNVSVTTTNTSATKKAAKKKSEKKAATKKKAPAAPLVTVPLNPGPAVCEANNVNVRGQAKLKSEVVGKLTKGQQVTVLEEVRLKNSAVDEPSAWAKITIPTNTLVWINTSFIDPANKTVKPKKLNVRGGPGENYSVLGTLKQGDPVKEVSTKGEWTQIEPPADAYAFVAAQFLRQGEAAPVVAAATPTTTPTTEPTPPTTTTTVTEPTIAPTTTEPTPTTTPPTTPPPTTQPTTTEPPPVTTSEPSTTTTNAPSEDTEPPPKRIVQREGIVRGTFSIQAPTRYELINPDNHKAINYLHSDSPDLDLSRYKGIRIIVTGEEGLDERWRNTPVISIQKIQVLDYGG